MHTDTSAQASTPAIAEEPDRSKWTAGELAELDRWREMQALLPKDAPRGLLSVRLSVFKDESTSLVRQELDLWALATQKGIRVVGVAMDPGQSATKIPPWKRKALGHWINERAPEFDVILFWKLDRFIRRIYDLHLMIEWCKEFGKNMISKIEELDFSTTLGQMMVTMIAGMARIEAENLGIRLTSLWQYARTTDRWVVGNPVYGYSTEKDPKTKEVRLKVNVQEKRIIRYAWIMRVKRKKSYGWICDALNSAGYRTKRGGKWRVTTLIRILRNPALMGVRVISDNKPGRYNPPRIFYGKDGNPVKVGPAILKEHEFNQLIEYDMSNAQNHPGKKGKSTDFLGVITCAYCKGNMIYQANKKKDKEGNVTKVLEYVRCFSTVNKPCEVRPSGRAEDIYGSLVQAVLDEIGDYEVVERVYVQGQDNAKKRKELQDGIRHYMKELEPGGQFAVGGFLQKVAEESLERLNAQLAELPEEAAQNRWEYRKLSGTYRQRWLLGDTQQMEEDLIRGGIKFYVYKDHAKLVVPEDVKKRLVLRKSYFEEDTLKEKARKAVKAG